MIFVKLADNRHIPNNPTITETGTIALLDVFIIVA